MDPVEAARNALSCVLEATPREHVLIVCDEEVREIGEIFTRAALGLGLWVRTIPLLQEEKSREEITPELRENLGEVRSDIVLNFLRERAEEAPFRLQLTRMERRRRVRLGHCPGINMDMLIQGALSLASKEYEELQSLGRQYLAVLQDAKEIRVTSPSGTDLTLSVSNRPFFTDVFFDWGRFKWINLPVGEVTVAPIESQGNGCLVCDMGIGGERSIPSPVTLTVVNGEVTRIECQDKALEHRVRQALEMDRWASVIAEFAVGLNRKARIGQSFLELEKIYGTIHVAFGNNLSFPGGKNPSKNHLDFLVGQPSVLVRKATGEEIKVVFKGMPCVGISYALQK
ncbi:MAG: aminopeptidase [Armatimonadetes bacterium]|nr:aminopeptidase [Armatimonadota bacterium]